MEWQPIETAPRDGTLIDLFAAGERRPDCKWDAGDINSDPQWVQRYAETGGCFFSLDVEPTHWMPVPEGPAGISR